MFILGFDTLQTSLKIGLLFITRCWSFLRGRAFYSFCRCSQLFPYTKVRTFSEITKKIDKIFEKVLRY